MGVADDSAVDERKKEIGEEQKSQKEDISEQSLAHKYKEQMEAIEVMINPVSQKPMLC
jgi:hypothetical protein